MDTSANGQAVSSADARTLLAAIRVLSKIDNAAAEMSRSTKPYNHAAYGRLAESADLAGDVLYRVLLVAGINCGEEPARIASRESVVV